MFDHHIPNLIHLASDLFVESLDHPFLVHLTMADSNKPLLINQIQLIKSSLDPIIFVQTRILHDPQRRDLDLDSQDNLHTIH